MIREVDKSYIAGFLDGDGCIGIYRVKRRRGASWHYMLQVIFVQSRIDKAWVLNYIHELYGGFIVNTGAQKRNPNCNPSWALRLSGNGAGILIKDCIDFMIVRSKQAELALQFLEFREKNNGQRFGRVKLTEGVIMEYENMRIRMNCYNKRGSGNEK